MTSSAVQARQADAEADAAARAEMKREQPKAPLIKPDGTPTPEGWRKINELLRHPMATKEFKGKGGRTYTYITARQVQDRLDAVVGPGNWSTEVTVIRSEHPVAVLLTMSIFGVRKTDAGYSNNPEADSPDDRAYEDEPLKAAVSDGFKRAAVQWGIGRWLYGDGVNQTR